MRTSCLVTGASLRLAASSSAILSASAMAAFTSLESAFLPMSIPSSASSRPRSWTSPPLADGSDEAITERYGMISDSARPTVVCIATATFVASIDRVPRTPRLRDIRVM